MTRKEFYENEIKEIEKRAEKLKEKKKTYKVGHRTRSHINFTLKMGTEYIEELKRKIKNL